MVLKPMRVEDFCVGRKHLARGCSGLQRGFAGKKRFLGRRMKARHIHWGGGTPNMVAPEDFLAVMAAIRARFDFAPGAELAVEIDPRKGDAVPSTKGILGG